MEESVFVDSSNTFPFPLLLLLELELELLLLDHCFEVDEWSDPGLVCESDPDPGPGPGPNPNPVPAPVMFIARRVGVVGVSYVHMFGEPSTLMMEGSDTCFDD